MANIICLSFSYAPVFTYTSHESHVLVTIYLLKSHKWNERYVLVMSLFLILYQIKVKVLTEIKQHIPQTLPAEIYNPFEITQIQIQCHGSGSCASWGYPSMQSESCKHYRQMVSLQCGSEDDALGLFEGQTSWNNMDTGGLFLLYYSLTRVQQVSLLMLVTRQEAHQTWSGSFHHHNVCHRRLFPKTGRSSSFTQEITKVLKPLKHKTFTFYI